MNPDHKSKVFNISHYCPQYFLVLTCNLNRFYVGFKFFKDLLGWVLEDFTRLVLVLLFQEIWVGFQKIKKTIFT